MSDLHNSNVNHLLKYRVKPLKFVSAPRVEQHTDNVAIIAWSTNAKTAGTVYYTSNKFNFDQAPSLQEAFVHRVELKNLEPATTYKLLVRTRYNDITQTSREFTFTTSAKTAKILFTPDGVPKIEQISGNSAVISWKTNIDSSGSVLYRTSPKGPSKLAEDLSLSTDHHVQIKNLSPGTKYYFTIWSSPVCITDHEKFTFETLGLQQAANR